MGGMMIDETEGPEGVDEAAADSTDDAQIDALAPDAIEGEANDVPADAANTGDRIPGDLAPSVPAEPAVG
jgi:hypothetical protein